jgi:hypothetical protein
MMTEDDWNDERLAAAFHTRFDRSAPPTVARAVHASIAGTTPTRFHAFEHLQGRHLATAAVVIVLVGALTVAMADVGRLGGGPSTPAGSGGVATVGASATPTAQAITGEAFSLPVIQVTDAIAVRDAGVDDRELAVQGWFAREIASCPAPLTKPINPLQTGCPDGFVWLMKEAESLVHQSGDHTSFGAPTGPALNPDFDDIDGSWEPTDPGFDTNGDSTPTDVVLVGHFDDRRAALCPEAEVAACRDRFVVHAVASVAGVPQPRSLVRDVSRATAVTVSSESDVNAIVANEAPQSQVLSMVVTDGHEGLATIEPSLADGQQGLTGRPVVWVVRVLESERVVTYIVVDGTDAVYEMTAEGEAIHVGGSNGDAIVTPEPWPPEGAVVVELTSEVGAGMPPVQVAVVDESGRLIGVSERGTVDPSDASIRTSGSLFDAYAEPGKPGRVHLTWIGGICDSHVTITVASDLRGMTDDIGTSRPDCDSVGVTREVVLDFAGSVDVSAIALSDAAGPPPSVDGHYALDCGPLGRGKCEQKAAAVVAANSPGSSTKRIASIAFSDECGSYTMLFDDGSGMAASVDCVLP